MRKILLLKKEYVWEEPKHLFQACHASTCLKNEQGDLLVAYFGGTREGAQDVGIWLSRKIKGVWQEPRRIKYMYGLPHWNPVLHRDGEKIILYYKVGHNCTDWYTMVTESDDFGETWTEAREAIPGDHTSRIVTKNRILVTEDGRWLAGTSSEYKPKWDCCIEISEDKGKSWSIHPIPFAHPGEPEKTTGVIQPALWQSDENTFHCLMRSTEGYVYRSDSTDNGNTWCEAYPTDIPNNNSGITVEKLSDSTLVLVYNPVGGDWGARTPLSAAISQDNGKSWSKCFDFETAEGEYSYPYVTTDGKTVDLVYTWNRLNIVHCEFALQEKTKM